MSLRREKMRRRKNMIATWLCTAGALVFCLMAGAAGYKQVAVAKEPVMKKVSDPPAPIYREEKIVIYNISANAALFYEEKAEPEIVPEDNEIELLAACVEAEAGNQDLYGKRLVTDVILNRVDSEEFPDSITEVITQPGQFSVYWNGAMDKIEASEETYQAVYMELEERSYPDLIFFNCGQYLPYGRPWKQIGAHYFSTM